MTTNNKEQRSIMTTNEQPFTFPAPGAINAIGRVYKTSDYTLFRFMPGNRAIAEKRAKRIKKSIVEFGHINNPIVVNEKLEIIDGQGRFVALQELNMPVEFIVFSGLTIDHCVALNISQTPWSVTDYVESYASLGNQSYKFLATLNAEYQECGMNLCLCACTGSVSGASNERLKSGKFTCTGEQYEKARELLNYIGKFMPTIKSFDKGSKLYICFALMFAYQVDKVNRYRMVEKFTKLYGSNKIPCFLDVAGALNVLTQIYNHKVAGERIYFEVEYNQFLSRRYPWYTKRHGKAGEEIE